MSHLMLLTKTSETPLTETLESATEMLQTSVSGAAAGGVGRISWVIMILLTFLTLLSVIVLTLLQIKIWKQQQALHERTWKRTPLLKYLRQPMHILVSALPNISCQTSLSYLFFN